MKYTEPKGTIMVIQKLIKVKNTAYTVHVTAFLSSPPQIFRLSFSK